MQQLYYTLKNNFTEVLTVFIPLLQIQPAGGGQSTQLHRKCCITQKSKSTPDKNHRVNSRLGYLNYRL